MISASVWTWESAIFLQTIKFNSECSLHHRVITSSMEHYKTTSFIIKIIFLYFLVSAINGIITLSAHLWTQIRNYLFEFRHTNMYVCVSVTERQECSHFFLSLHPASLIFNSLPLLCTCACDCVWMFVFAKICVSLFILF